jgi:hypothetical protein
MEQSTILSFSVLKGEFFEPSSIEHPILTSGYEIPSSYIITVQKLSFFGLSSDNPYHHLREFEQVCSCITITGMPHDTLKWKLFPFSLVERDKQWYMKIVGSMNGNWDDLVDKFGLKFFHDLDVCPMKGYRIFPVE